MTSHGRRTAARAWSSPGRVGAVPKNFKPFRDRRVSTKDEVACPVESCLAAVGEHCRNSAGANMPTCHPRRRKMAIRKQNERLNIEDVELPD